MKPPKCRLCEEKHWGMCPKFRGPVADAVKKLKRGDGVALTSIAHPTPAKRKNSLNPAALKTIEVEIKKMPVAPTKQGWNRVAYNRYQRELMRKRRAAKKK